MGMATIKKIYKEITKYDSLIMRAKSTIRTLIDMNNIVNC